MRAVCREHSVVAPGRLNCSRLGVDRFSGGILPGPVVVWSQMAATAFQRCNTWLPIGRSAPISASDEASIAAFGKIPTDIGSAISLSRRIKRIRHLPSSGLRERHCASTSSSAVASAASLG